MMGSDQAEERGGQGNRAITCHFLEETKPRQGKVEVRQDVTVGS